MWKAIVALAGCIGVQVAKGQDIVADELAFRQQVERYIGKSPQDGKLVDERLTPLFRHMQGEWFSEPSRKTRSPWERPEVILKLTISGLNVRYAEVQDGEELRATHGRLEIDPVELGLRIRLPAGADATRSSREEDLSEFDLPTLLSASEYNMRQHRSEASLSCRFNSEEWHTFESQENFIAGLQIQLQLAAQGPPDGPFVNMWSDMTVNYQDEKECIAHAEEYRGRLESAVALGVLVLICIFFGGVLSRRWV